MIPTESNNKGNVCEGILCYLDIFTRTQFGLVELISVWSAFAGKREVSLKLVWVAGVGKDRLQAEVGSEFLDDLLSGVGTGATAVASVTQAGS